MDKVFFKKFLKENIIILDGATGTELQKMGMPKGVCPERWICENKDVLIKLQKEYIKAGSKVVYTCSFGGNRGKLSEYSLGDKVFEINKKLAEISKEACEGSAFVAGDLAPTGSFIEPFGSVPFENIVNVYKEQIEGLLAGGVDFFIIETMIDLQEARAALLAVKEMCDLPVCVSMTFDEDGYTLTGTDPMTALMTMQGLGVDAFGCNCSTGPQKIINIIRNLKLYAKVPLMAKPNAGLPKLVNGKTNFDMGSDEFASFAEDFVKSGANLIGGCCGTSPVYIEKLSNKVLGQKPTGLSYMVPSCITSSRRTVFIGEQSSTIIIGERINPTGKKKLQEDLKGGALLELRRLAIEQVEQGADILDVNVGMPGIDEEDTMAKAVAILASTVDIPVCIDSSSPVVIEKALRIYPGRVLVNSITGESEKLEKLIPIISKYGAMFVALPIDDNGIPQTIEKRKKIINNIYKRAKDFGIEKKDMVVDGLLMTISSNPGAALETLTLIKWCTSDFGCKTVVGLSNVSFGLPERKWINSAFFIMAIESGLTMAIANPSSQMLMNLRLAYNVLKSKDGDMKKYISFFSQEIKHEVKDKGLDKTSLENIYDCIINGDKAGIIKCIEGSILNGAKISTIIDKFLIPAITHVGELYERKIYFLPQLIGSAESMRVAFDYLEPFLLKDKKSIRNKGTVVLATVKGDIHDIGKNIVGLMLKNYGYVVRDLGKDVASEQIVKEAIRYEADIIGLSALMTTTMIEMKEVIKLVKQNNLRCKVIVGGAVVNEKYSKEIGADGYSSNAHEAVKLVTRLLVF